MPDVEFPDAEGMCVAFAKTKTNAVVATKVAATRPVLYARVYRTGGAASNRVVDNPQMTVTVGAKAGSLAALGEAKKLRHAFLNQYTEMPLVRGVREVSGLYHDPDPDTGEDRYTFTIQLTVRGKR